MELYPPRFITEKRKAALKRLFILSMLYNLKRNVFLIRPSFMPSGRWWPSGYLYGFLPVPVSFYYFLPASVHKD